MSSELAGVSACSRAATAEEAAFRIDYPLATARNTRVVALDPGAAEIVREAAALEWGQTKFYVASDPGDQWISMTGETLPFGDEIAESNTVVLVSTDGTNAEAAGTIGAACKVRGIMTAGLVVTPGQIATDTLMVLRPHARILLVPAEPDDLVELLRATRA
jgi:hypothetical protein